ncbi:MAG: cytochrome P450 [Chloroflexota bacterium]|nr:cytochrome P450 [Chloroflexota bacterium]
MATVAPNLLDDLLTSSAFVADPYPVYDRLREEAPVYRSEAVGAWVLTRYDDVAATLKDPRRLSSRGRFSAVLDRLEPDERPRFRPLEDHFAVGLLGSDPPDHTRLRGLINRAFTPRVVEALRPRVQQIVDGLLDAVRDRGGMDAIADFAYPLPATVIAELLGAPHDTLDEFKRWSDGILSFQGTGQTSPETLDRAQRDLLEMRAFLTELLEHRRHAPADDLLSRMVAAEADGDKLSSAELLTTCVTLLTAGHETTTNLIGNGLLSLLRHPDQLRRLRDDPALMPTAVEEMLRFESPLQRNPRRVAEDLELGGQTLRRGDFVLQVLGAANHDPARFPDPHRFDVARQPNRHLAFGHGIHFCLGAPLARIEAPIALGALIERFPDLRLATDAPDWQPHGLLRALKALPVAF